MSASTPNDSVAGDSRRRWMQYSLSKMVAWSAAAWTMSSTTGCVPASASGSTELVWGRRGQSDGRFLKPRAITIDRNDQLYIVDTTGRIQVFDRDGVFLRKWQTPETANGRPTGLAIGRGTGADEDQEVLLVADTHYYRMLVYRLDGERLPDRDIGGTSGRNPGEFAFVTDAVQDHDGCYYIGEYGDSDRIQKFDPQGQFMTQWGGTGREPEKFVRPQSLEIAAGVLWVADACNHRIQRFDVSGPTPRWIDAWGSQGQLPGQFHYPYDLSILDDGGVLVCEYGNQRVQRLSADGKPVAIWGAPGFAVGQLYQPWGVVVDSHQRMQVLDSNNHRVQRAPLPT